MANTGESCLIDSGTTHTILRNSKYFTELIPIQANVKTISGNPEITEGAGKASIVLPMGTNLKISNAVYSSKSQRNLISFKDMRQNGFHIQTMT